MMNRLIACLAAGTIAGAAFAKLPPAAPMTDAQKAEKAAKDKGCGELQEIQGHRRYQSPRGEEEVAMRASVVVAGVAIFVAGCAHNFAEAPKATADLAATKNSIVRGNANFVQLGDKVRVTVSLSGLAPNGEYGFHIHEVGDCSSGDGMSAKGHFNPFGKPHAQAGMMEHHAGDLPSVRSDKNGHVALVADVDVITVTPGPASIIGRGLIVHAQADDYRTQPTGNAGARSACGVIKLVEKAPEGPAKAVPKPPAKEPAKEPAKPAAQSG